MLNWWYTQYQKEKLMTMLFPGCPLNSNQKNTKNDKIFSKKWKEKKKKEKKKGKKILQNMHQLYPNMTSTRHLCTS